FGFHGLYCPLPLVSRTSEQGQRERTTCDIPQASQARHDRAEIINIDENSGSAQVGPWRRTRRSRPSLTASS
ncbi:MAG TPA: hypothetical protein VNU48_07310, partial [Burkholderiaceae bacterium]|nr:hypothetical protein [Burkholderiaceae bacterium]